MNDREIDKLDNLPTRVPMHRHGLAGKGKGCHCAYCYEKHGTSFSYRKVRRWLVSREGKHLDEIVHEFVNLSWIPVAKRTYSFFCQFVETHTFKDSKGRIKFFDSFSYRETERSLDEAWGEVFYIHPKTKRLHYKPKNGRVRYSKKRAAEMAEWFVKLGDYDQLIKLDGIWYHVYALPSDIMATPPAHRYDPNAPLLYDFKYHRKYFYGPFDLRWREHVMLRPKVYKYQLPHERLKQYGLKNDHNNVVSEKCKVCGSFNCILHPV